MVAALPPPPFGSPLSPPPPSGAGHWPWEAGSYLSRFLNVEKGGELLFRASQLGLINQGPLRGPLLTCVPLPNFTMSRFP